MSGQRQQHGQHELDQGMQNVQQTLSSAGGVLVKSQTDYTSSVSSTQQELFSLFESDLPASFEQDVNQSNPSDTYCNLPPVPASQIFTPINTNPLVIPVNNIIHPTSHSISIQAAESKISSCIPSKSRDPNCTLRLRDAELAKQNVPNTSSFVHMLNSDQQDMIIEDLLSSPCQPSTSTYHGHTHLYHITDGIGQWTDEVDITRKVSYNSIPPMKRTSTEQEAVAKNFK